MTARRLELSTQFTISFPTATNININSIIILLNLKFSKIFYFQYFYFHEYVLFFELIRQHSYKDVTTYVIRINCYKVSDAIRTEKYWYDLSREVQTYYLKYISMLFRFCSNKYHENCISLPRCKTVVTPNLAKSSYMPTRKPN